MLPVPPCTPLYLVAATVVVGVRMGSDDGPVAEQIRDQ